MAKARGFTPLFDKKIVEAFQYDDFARQKKRGIKVSDPKRAEGLHRVLYQCPHCKAEFRMASQATRLSCQACRKEWEMTELGELCAINGETEFSHIPEWYEWERGNVRREVEAGTYSSGELRVKVESLPNSKKYIPLGTGTMIHDMSGFHVSCVDAGGDRHEMEKSVASMYSCHIEYQYLFKHGDCIDLNTLRDTWYIYPEGDFAVTKMAIATEELYRHELLKKGTSLTEGIL